jgi:hypothetical protein
MGMTLLKHALTLLKHALNFATSFNLSTVTVLALIFASSIVLGMFMDPVSMTLITIPIFFPLIATLDVNPLWFGLFMLIALEMSQTRRSACRCSSCSASRPRDPRRGRSRWRRRCSSRAI